MQHLTCPHCGKPVKLTLEAEELLVPISAIYRTDCKVTSTCKVCGKEWELSETDLLYGNTKYCFLCRGLNRIKQEEKSEQKIE